MNFLFVFVFVFTLFIYIHIYHHLKTNNKLELVDIQYTTKEMLDEICDIRQPVRFISPFPIHDYINFKEFDVFSPTCTVHKSYSKIDGENIDTKLQYHLDYKTYIIMQKNDAIIRLYAPESKTIMMIQENYETFSFTSNMKNYGTYIDIKINEGDIIYIPAYWIWNIRSKKCKAIIARYMTPMNIISILPYLLKYIWLKIYI